MFWRRKKGSDFISLGLNTPLEPEVEQQPEAKPEKPEAAPAPPPPPPPVSVLEPVRQTAVEPTPRVEPPPRIEPVPRVEPKPQPSPPPSFQPSAPPSPQPSPQPGIATIQPVAEPAIVPSPAEDEGFMRRFRRAVQATRESISTRLDEVVRGKKQIDAATLDELEEVLIGADIGVQTTLAIVEDVRKQVARQALKDVDELKRVIKARLLAILKDAELARGVASETSVPDTVRPYVMMVVGVNGAGKTTTIGKLAQRIKAEGNEVLICAADTFRAAASDQLAIWAERAGVPLIQQRPGTDPAAVLFDSLKAARAREADVLIVDTAGRLHNKAHLMAELEKMKRTAAKVIPGAPHDILLVLDATTGQNGLDRKSVV